MNLFPVDIESAAAYGLKHWHGSFHWPVSCKWIDDAETQIKAVLTGLIDEADELESELLVINYKLLFEYLRLLHCLKVSQWARESKLRLSYDNVSVSFRGVEECGVPGTPLLTLPEIVHPNQWQSIKQRLRMAWLTQRVNRSVYQKAKALLGRSSHFVVGQVTPLMEEYIRNQCSSSVVFNGQYDWYTKSDVEILSSRETERINSLAEECIIQVRTVFEERGVELDKGQCEYLNRCTYDMLSASLACLKVLKRAVERLCPKSLFLSSGGVHFNRMLATAARSVGATVTGFAHGEPVVYDFDKYAWNELSTVDHFVTWQGESANLMTRLLCRFPPLNGNRVTIESAETDSFRRIWRYERRKVIPKTIKTVMFVANGFSPRGIVGGIGLPELIQLDWELRVVGILRQAGYRVIYKSHPERELMDRIVGEFFDVVAVVRDRFEDVLDKADAFVFCYTRSTTLGAALCTNKPIIYIDGGWEKWLPEMREPFARRCRIVQATFDDRNRLIFDEEKLLDALAQKPVEPNTEFIEKYMFPDGVKV
jgi:hypothetical protein